MLFPCLFLFTIRCASSTAGEKKLAETQDSYQCIPCGSDCDKENFETTGTCPHCKMKLVKRATVNFKTIEPVDLCNYIQTHPDVVLLDVRTKEEFEGKKEPFFGTLKNAINVPVQELETRLSELSPYKEKEIIVYCSHSHRSPRASYILTQNGFSNVTNMAGGMSVIKDRSCLK